jgi:hypothetical protein
MAFFVAPAGEKMSCADIFATHAGHPQAYERNG